jgi:uroporphyrin-III C-methyltransferase/precorrin-2 dehydrogenase/sirohydrochlorin ferrochelatase
VTGFVSLVGAGPGDPDLLTRRALDRLSRADLVLYDALGPSDVQALAPQAHCFFVGKRAGCHALDQDGINQLLVRAGKRGQRVVRLKGGDPFVLGRGGEEALALVAAGVPFEIVPGVSSAIAGPALAGIPVTHRGIAAGFLVVSGHLAPSWQPVLAALPPASVTVCVLMGVAQRGAIADFLIGHGWSATTPAAIVFGASGADSHTWIGTLAGLGAAAEHHDLPGILVIGGVVELAAQLAPALAASAASADDGTAARAAQVDADAIEAGATGAVRR